MYVESQLSNDPAPLLCQVLKCFINIWNAKNGKKVVGLLVGHNSTVNSVSFSPDGFHIVFSSSDNSIRVHTLSEIPGIFPGRLPDSPYLHGRIVTTSESRNG